MYGGFFGQNSLTVTLVVDIRLLFLDIIIIVLADNLTLICTKECLKCRIACEIYAIYILESDHVRYYMNELSKTSFAFPEAFLCLFTLSDITGDTA